MISFWEKNSFLSYDIIILGAGINGLSAACSFKEKFPLKRILILERGSWPVGASTRNAGFACYGTFTEIKSDIANIGLDKALQLVEWRVKGFQNHLKRLGPDKMGYIKTGGGELLFENETYANDELNEVNNHLSPFFDGAVYASDFSKVSEFGFNPAGISQYISNSQEGQLDSGLLMKNLWEYATSLGHFYHEWYRSG
jgi:glycine/D-amino acid oxidase-like deaminating enzyme